MAIQVKHQRYLEDKTYAQWVALNIADQIQLGMITLPTHLDELEGTTELMNTTWYWRAAMLLIYSSSTIAQWLYLKHENNVLQQQITDLYKQVFPNATSVISPKLRIEQEMQNKQANLSNDEFLYLLAQAGKVLTQQKHIELENIAFQDDELVLRVHSKTVPDLANLQAQLKKQTIQVEQKETSSTKTGVEAEFHIKRAT